MKKIPKSINLLGRKWKIKTVNKGGAEFATGNAEIIIGTKYPSRIPENLVHELLEIILAESELFEEKRELADKEAEEKNDETQKK